MVVIICIDNYTMQAQWCMESPVTEAVSLTHTWTPELANINPPVQEETASVILKFRCLIINNLLCLIYNDYVKEWWDGSY